MNTTRLRLGVGACPPGHPAGSDGAQHFALSAELLGRHFEFISWYWPGTVEALTSQGICNAEERGVVSGVVIIQSPSPAFMAALKGARPSLPIEEYARLHDPVLLENFMTRVFAHARWQELQRSALTRQQLTRFHESYKYQLMATDREEYRRLGRLVAHIGEWPLAEFAPAYFEQLMQALSKPATRGSHTNVLQHLAGYLKHDLSREEKQELQQLIDQYRTGAVSLVAPIMLLRQHFQRHPDRYIARQAYLQPHPDELGLRNAL